MLKFPISTQKESLNSQKILGAKKINSVVENDAKNN
jgi:hypothetical protein